LPLPSIPHRLRAARAQNQGEVELAAPVEDVFPARSTTRTISPAPAAAIPDNKFASVVRCIAGSTPGGLPGGKGEFD